MRQEIATGWHGQKRAARITIRAPASNRKLAPVALVANDSERLRPEPRAPFVAATYLPVAQTCSDRCRFKNNGCMAQDGFTGNAVRRLESLAADSAALDIVKAEAIELDLTWRDGIPQRGGRDGRSGIDLRLHVSGDCPSVVGAYWLAGAAMRWRERGGGVAWTYTHSWRDVERSAWGEISVLASIERAADASRVRARGYAPALVVEHFPDGPRAFRRGGTTWIPCPAETLARTCVECRLCLDKSDWMRDTKRGIAFEVHGPGATKAKRRLEVIAA